MRATTFAGTYKHAQKSRKSLRPAANVAIAVCSFHSVTGRRW